MAKAKRKQANRPKLIDVSFRKLADGEFGLVLNLNEVDKEIDKLPDRAIIGDNKTQDKDSFKITVNDADGNFVGSEEVIVSNSQADRMLEITFAKNLANLPEGLYRASVEMSRPTGKRSVKFQSVEIFIPDPAKIPQMVSLQPFQFDDTPDQNLWEEIKELEIDFRSVEEFVDDVLCSTGNFSTQLGNGKTISMDPLKKEFMRNHLPFVNVDEYSLVLFSIDAYMRRALMIDSAKSYFNSSKPLPYYTNLSESLEEIVDDYIPRSDSFVRSRRAISPSGECADRLGERAMSFPAIELIWSYWMEQAMLVQTMGAINLRFQNIAGTRETEPLRRFDTSPLRPLSNILWGFIQNEQHHTTLYRRVHEYLHAYNLNLIGKAVPQGLGVDNRSNFLAAFHNLLHQLSIFYKDYDDMTRRADGFAVLTSLRELHLLLAEGNHNAYFNMTWTTRAEMLTMQYILARQEMRLFLGGRPMVPYPEQWMDRVDTMKQIQGWDSTSVLHYYDLAVNGEKLLLGVRYGDWTESSYDSDAASNWAIAFRDQAQKYINAYRVVTSTDLSVDSVQFLPEQLALQPSILIQRRLEATKARPANKLLSPKGTVLRQY